MIRRWERNVIMVETFQRTIVRRHSQPARVWCERCPAKTEMLRADEAAAVLQTTTREIFRRVETGEVHFLEMHNGAVFVCSRSPKTKKELP